MVRRRTRRSARRTSEIHVHHLGGAVARVPADATAFGDRDAQFVLNIVARWPTRRRGATRTSAGRAASCDARRTALTAACTSTSSRDEGGRRPGGLRARATYARLVALKDT